MIESIQSLIGEVSAVELICVFVIIISCIRVIIEKNTAKKFLYLNAFSFAIVGLFTFIIPAPYGIWGACIYLCVYFIGSTLESNAISSTYSKRHTNKETKNEKEADRI